MRPLRPSELDQLNAFVGRWEWEGRGTIADGDQPVGFTGTRESHWEGDGWYLVTHEVGNMEGVGMSRTLIVWWYDARAGKFRTSYVDSMGTSMSGTAEYDQRTATWECRAISRSRAGAASATGHVRFPNPDTMQWDWVEYSRSGRETAVELTGVCRRIP